MHANPAPEDPPTLRRWLCDNGYLIKRALWELYRYNGGAVLRHVQHRLEEIQFGPSPFAFDWDACIVLDACRPDALGGVADEYDWLPEDIPVTRSPASWSKGWMAKSFTDKYATEMAETVHVTWNPFSDGQLDAGGWAVLEEVWRDGWDDGFGGVTPRAVTDRAIRAGREQRESRLLVHYQQPHDPYLGIDAERLQRGDVGDPAASKRTVWDRLIDPDDELTDDVAWAAMLDTLRWVLDDVELLLSNLDADRVLLTADHGDAFGWLGIYGHGPGMPIPDLVRVPHVWLSATDTGRYQPADDVELGGEMAVEERLAALGYR